jgi:acetyltransferase-like isoleucine patch superfamily enzyme
MIKEIVSILPGKSGDIIRYHFYKKKLAKCGKSIRFAYNMQIISPEKLFLGNNIELGWDTLFDCNGDIHIGDNSGVAPGTYLLSESPIYENPDKPICQQGTHRAPIIIESDVWVGANCIINPGVKIGTGAVVAGGSVVSSDIPAYALVAGNPARTIGWRKKSDTTTGNSF